MPKPARTRTGYAVIALIGTLALAGCTGTPPAPAASNGDPSAEGAAPSTPATPTPTPPTEEELQLRALTVDDIPTPGYAAMPNDDGPSGIDTSDAGVCQLNLGSVVTDGSGEPDFPYVESTFERASTNDRLLSIVAAAPDPVGFVTDIENALAACPSSSSADEVAVMLEPLLEGDVPFDAPDSSCRTFQMTFAQGSAAGSLCFVAVDDVVVATIGYTTPTWSYRSADEFAGITLAAIEKARA